MATNGKTSDLHFSSQCYTTSVPRVEPPDVWLSYRGAWLVMNWRLNFPDRNRKPRGKVHLYDQERRRLLCRSQLRSFAPVILAPERRRDQQTEHLLWVGLCQYCNQAVG